MKIPAIFRVLRLLSLVVWVGGLIFFAFILAPIAFGVMPSNHLAGLVVGGTLRVLNQLGISCGLVFVLATISPWLRSTIRQRKLLFAELLCIFLMAAATLYVQSIVIPAMERARIAAGGDIDAAPANNPGRIEFERLHPRSEKVEGAALLLGLGVVVLLGCEKCEVCESNPPAAVAS